MKSNFAQAMRELTGFGEVSEATENNETQTYNTSPQTDMHRPAPTSPESVGRVEFNPREELSAFEVDLQGKRELFEFTPSEDSTQITDNMTVKGDILSHDDIVVNGHVYGNISTSKTVTVKNLVIGNISADSALLNVARVKGNFNIPNALNIGENSVVAGDIKAKNIKVSGKVKGTMDIDESAFFAKTALIAGNVTAGDVSTESGVRVYGAITTRQRDPGFDIDKEFDFGGEF